MRFLLVSFVLLILSSLGCGSKAEPRPIRIGQLIPLQGRHRLIGRHARQGAEQAVADYGGSEHLIAGRPYVVLHVDDHSDTALAEAETVRLLTVNKVAALIAGFDASLTARVVRAGKPYETPIVVVGELTAANDSSAVLPLGLSPAVRGRHLARYAATELQARRAAVLSGERQSAAAALTAAFVKDWPNREGNGVEEWTFTNAAERDEDAERIVHTAPDVILLACSLSDFRAVRPKLIEALPKTPLLYGGADAGAAPLQAGLETRGDVYLATAFSVEHLSESGRDFAHRYQERFHEAADLYAAQSYDAVHLLCDALRRTGDGGKDALAKELSQVERFESVMGSICWKDRQVRRRVFLIALKNNRAEVVRIIEVEEN